MVNRFVLTLSWQVERSLEDDPKIESIQSLGNNLTPKKKENKRKYQSKPMIEAL